MSGTSNKTIIFVPGAWHTPECWHQVGDILRSRGYNIDYVYLPTVGPVEFAKGFEPDIDEIRKHIIKAVDAGQQVVLVAHSYGGLPASEATHGLDYATRKAGGWSGGVIHIVYCSAIMLQVGQSIFSTGGRTYRPWQRVSEDEMENTVINPEEMFYNDLPESEAQKWAAKLKPFSCQALRSQVRYEAWREVPCTYLHCLQDKSLPLSRQEMMVNAVREAGVSIKTQTLDTSHSPFLSKPEETADAIDRAAKLGI